MTAISGNMHTIMMMSLRRHIKNENAKKKNV